MRFFVFSLFLLLLFDSFQGSTLPSIKSLGELNTTLKTNIDGTYQRINPCTQKECQSTSCVGSHEFSHHVSGENLSDYSQKCSAIIKSFLQAIGNLVGFDSNPNGTFNINVNTSITHKDGNCDSKDGRPIPTIIIEATGCEVPSPCNSPVEKDKNSQINISQQSAKGQHNSGELIVGKPNLTSQGQQTSASGVSKTSQAVTEIIETPAQDKTPKNQAGRFQGLNSRTPENVAPTGTVMLLPIVPQRSPMKTTTETTTETITEISKIERNSDVHGPLNRPTIQPANFVANSLTLLPEEKFTSPAPPPPDTLDLGNPSGITPSIPVERGFVPQRIPQPTTVDQFIPNPYQPAPVGMDQPLNDNSRQLFNDELGGQAPVNQQSANFFPSPTQIPVTNLPSTDDSNAFTDDTQLERPFAYPVASSLGEPQPVQLPFSKPPLRPQAPTAGPPATNNPKHFPNQLRTTTPFPPTMVKPEFDELPGQGLVTRPPLTKNDIFNGPGKPFPHDQRLELTTPLPPIQTSVIKNEGSQGLTTKTLPINQPVHHDNIAFAPKDSSKFSAVNNRHQPDRPQVFPNNQPTSRISQPHQQFPTETFDMNRFPVNTLPKPAFGPNFHERPGISHPLNPFEHLATPKTQTLPPQFTASLQTPPKPFPQPTANLDIPQPQPTLPYEDKPLTTPAPQLHSLVEETNNKDAVMPNSGYINPRIPPPLSRPEPQLKSPKQIPPVILTQQQTGHFNNVQPPQNTAPEPPTTLAPELTPSFDYDYQYPNYEYVDYDYPVHQPPNSTSTHPQNPTGSVHRQFHPRAHSHIRKFPRHFFPRQHPMRNPQIRHHPHIRKHKNNMKFINTTIPEQHPQYDYEYVDEVAPEQMPNYDYYYDYAQYPQFPVNAPPRGFPPNFSPQRHGIRNLKNSSPPHFGKPIETGIPTSVERTSMSGLNPVLQHNNNGRQNSDFINPPIMTQPETQFTDEMPPSGTPPPEKFQTVQPVLTTTAYENETLTTEFQATAEPEHDLTPEPVQQRAEGIQQVLDHGEQQIPNFNQPELQGDKAPADQFPPSQPPMRNFEAPQPQPVARKFENETISADIQTAKKPNYQFNNQNIRDRWVGQMPNSYNPRHQVPNGFFQPRQPFRGGAPFHRGFPVHQQPIRNFRPIFTPENKSQFQSAEKPEFDNQFINRRNPGQMSNFRFAGQVPNTFNQPPPQLRGNAHAVRPVGWAPPSEEHPARNLETGHPGPNPPTVENESQITVQPDFQPQQDSQNAEDREAEKIPDSHFSEGHVQNTFDHVELPAKGNEPIVPVEQQQNFVTNQPSFTTYENETVTTEFQTTVRPEHQPPAKPINQHIDGKQILPPPVSDFNGHQTPNSGQSQYLMNRHPEQSFQQPMNLKVPPSHHSSEEQTASRDFQPANIHYNYPHSHPHVEQNNRHIENRWTGQRPNFQFRGQQVPNTFPQPGQQFRGGVPISPSFPAKQPPVRILENAQPQFPIAAHEDITTVAPEHQSSLETHQSISIEQQTQETQNLGPVSDSQITKSPSREFPSASTSKQDQERNFQISQPHPASDRTYEEETFTTAPQPSHENVTGSDLAEQQNQNNFDQSRLNVPSRQFLPNISPQSPMETSQALQPHPAAQPTHEFQAPVNYNRGMSNYPFRNPQNPRPFLQRNFQPRPNAPFHGIPPNFIPQQHLMRNIQMGPPRRIYKNETIPQPKNHFINQQNPNNFGRPESQVHVHFHQFPLVMHQMNRHNGPSFVKRPPMEFPPSRGLSRIPEFVPGPFSDTRTANRFVNPPNNNRPVVNRHNFQPKTALIHSDRNLDYDTPTSFYNSRPTPNENQPEPQPDLIPGARTSDEYLSATSSDETNTTSPPLPNTSVDYEHEENVPLAVSPYLGQVLNDNVTTPKPNTSALYSEQITPVISSPRLQPPADISTSEHKNSLYSQLLLTRPESLDVIAVSESTEQAFGGDQPSVMPVRKESGFSANPDGNPARAEVTADILEKQIERNNPVSMPQSNSFAPHDSANAFSFQHQNQPILNTPDNRHLVDLGTTPPPHIDTTTTTFEQVTSESYRNGNMPLKLLTIPQPISMGQPQTLSPETPSPVAPFIPPKQLPPATENPITNQPSGLPRHLPAPISQTRVPPVPRPSIPTFNQPEQQKPFEKRNLHVDRPYPLALGPPNHPTPSPQPIFQQQHNQPQNPHQVQRMPERNFNSEKQQMVIPQHLNKPEVRQQPSGIPSMNRQSYNAQSTEIMTSEQTKLDDIATTALPPQSQPQDVPFSQPNHQNFNSVNSFVTPVNQQSNAIHLNQQSPIQISSDVSRPQADSFIQAGSEVEPQSMIPGNDRQPPVDFNLQKIPFKPVPTTSPQLPQPNTVVKTRPKTSNQQQFDQRTIKFPQPPSPQHTTTTYEEVTTTTDSTPPTYYSGIPLQLLKSPVNAPNKFQNIPKPVENPDFAHSELPSPVTVATSSQVSPPYVHEINPNLESQYAHKKIPTNFPPPIAEPQPQPAIQDYKTTERPVLKLKPKTLAIADPQNQKDFTNADNSNRQLQANLNIPPPTPPHPDHHLHPITTATTLKTSEMTYNPLAPLHVKHDQQSAQDNLEFIDNSPQSQPTTAVKYSEKIQTAEYEPSRIPRPQPQTALNNSGRQTKDNSANVWTDQQQQITGFGVTPPMTYDRVPPRHLDNIDTQSKSPPQHIDSTPQTHESRTTETYEQEIFTINNPQRQTPQPVLILGDKVPPRNPVYNQLTTPPPPSITHETALNPNQQIPAATEVGHTTSQIAESQLTIPKYQTTPSSHSLDHPTSLTTTSESIYSEHLSKPDPLVLVPLSKEHKSETTEEVIINQKTATVPPLKQSVTKIPGTIPSIEHESVTLLTNPPRKTKIVEEIITTELPKQIVNSPITTQLAFAEKLLNYETKKLSNLQQGTTPSPVVENNYSSTPPEGSSSYSEQIVFGGNAFPKNFEKDNEQLEGSSPPNHVSTSTPQRPQQVILDNPTSSFDGYDQQHSTQSPDMFPEYDEIPPNFNARTGQTKGHPDEKSHVTFPMQPQPSVNSGWTTPIPSDSFASKIRKDVRDTTTTLQPGFRPSVSTLSNLQDHPTTERFTSFSRPDGSSVRTMSNGKEIQPVKRQVEDLEDTFWKLKQI